MMILSHSDNEEAMKLTKGILIYEGGDKATASLHDIERDAQTSAPLIMPGRAMTTEAMSSVLQKLAGNASKSRSLVPYNLLCCEAGRLIWHLPSHRRLIFFKTSNAEFNKACNGKSALHPALLFVAEGHSLYIYALDSDERPNGKTQLYHAPYFNVYERGSMCNGSVRPPASAYPRDIPQWEKLFFDTNFSHTNGDARRLTGHPKGHDGLWRELVRTRGRGVHQTFPTKLLTPTGKQVKDILNGKL